VDGSKMKAMIRIGTLVPNTQVGSQPDSK